MILPHLFRWGFILHLFTIFDTIKRFYTYFIWQLNTKRNLKRNAISFFPWGFCKDCKGCKTCNVELLNFRSVTWGKKFFKRKKKKKERTLSMWKENEMQYFFAKSIYVFYFAEIVFAKNPVGLDIVSSFS